MVTANAERAGGGTREQAGGVRAGGQERGRADDALHRHPGGRQEVRLQLRQERALQVPDRRGTGHQGLGGGRPGHVRG